MMLLWRIGLIVVEKFSEVQLEFLDGCVAVDRPRYVVAVFVPAHRLAAENHLVRLPCKTKSFL